MFGNVNAMGRVTCGLCAPHLMLVGIVVVQFYFACPVRGHCKNGQIIEIMVEA